MYHRFAGARFTFPAYRYPLIQLLFALALGLCAAGAMLIILGRFEGARAAPAAAHLYVKTDGSDLYNCTSWTSPCKTILGAYNKAASGDTIHVGSGVFNEHISFAKDMTVIGTPRSPFTVVNGSQPNSVFTVQIGKNVSFSDLVIHNTQPNIAGSGILNSGQLNLSHVSLTNITNVNRYGALAAYSGSVSVLDEVTIQHNTVNSYTGGIYNAGSMTITNSTIADNTASDGWVGGIYNTGSLVMSDVVIRENHATDYGGGIYNDGVITMTNSSVLSNTTPDVGGGIYNYDRLAVIGGAISGNQAGSSAGGLYNIDRASLERVVLAGNSSLSTGGGIGNQGELFLTDVSLEENSADDGGGLYNSGWAWLRNVTFYKNSAVDGPGAGMINFFGGNAELVNVTVSENTAHLSIAAGAAGIWNYSGNLTAFNCTIVNNHVTGVPVAGGIANLNGSAVTTLDNCIIANNDNANCGGTIGSSFGRNIDDEDDNTCGVDDDLYGFNPLLGPMDYYGGFTRAYQPLAGSPAIDNGEDNPNVCADTDQRGFPRPADGDGNHVKTCDIGSIEVGLSVYLPVVLR
jgi:hypothetical protein